MTILTRVRHRILTLALVLAAALVVAPRAQAQISVTNTTLNAATTTASAGNNGFISVTSTTGMTAGVELYLDKEALRVLVTPTGTSGQVAVQRGYDATMPAKHANSTLVYIGPSTSTATPGSGPFWYTDPPLGVCAVTDELYNLHINVRTGQFWQCVGLTWVNVIDGVMMVGPGNCFYTTSGGTFAAQSNVGVTGTTGLGLVASAAGVASLPVMEVSTTNSGTATNTLSCTIPIPSRVNIAKGVEVVDATFFYGVYQNAAGTQVAVLASGTMNGQAVFTTVTMPVPGASETASTVLPVRWDAGTLLITPVVASANVSALTVGQFDSVKFTPATALAMTSDLTVYEVNLTILCTATTATSIATPGVLVHYRYVSDL